MAKPGGKGKKKRDTKKSLPGLKEAKSLRPKMKGAFKVIESSKKRHTQRIQSSRSFRLGNTSRIKIIEDLDDIVLLFNLYEKYITNRFEILGGDTIKTALTKYPTNTDDHLNTLYINKMSLIFQQENFGNVDFYPTFNQLLNKLCNIGRVLTVLIRSYHENKNTFRGYLNIMNFQGGIPKNLASRYYTIIPGMRKAATNSSIGAFSTNLNFSHLKFDSTTTNILLTNAINFTSFFEAFKETNDVTTLLTNLIKTRANVTSNKYRNDVVNILGINITNIQNTNAFNLAIRIIGALRSPEPTFYPIPMLPPPFKGNRHHMFPIASLPNLIRTGQNFMPTSGKVVSLNLALFYLDAITMEKTFPKNMYKGKNVKSANIRGVLDKSIIRQEPALLKDVKYLSKYMAEINRVYTDARHGTIHTHSTLSRFNAHRGKLGMNVLRDPVTGLQTRLSNAYAEDVANLDLEMYTLLDTQKYQPVTFDNGGNLILLTDATVIADNSLVDKRYFFQHFLYIFNVGTMPRSEIDLLKKLYLSRPSGIHGNISGKKFCIQTTKENIRFLIDYIYDKPLKSTLSKGQFQDIVQTYYTTIPTKRNKDFSILSPTQQKEILTTMQLVYDNQISYNDIQKQIYETWEHLGLV